LTKLVYDKGNTSTTKLRNENETKRNETKRNTTKRNEKWRNETKRNEVSQTETKCNETKRTLKKGNEIERNETKRNEESQNETKYNETKRKMKKRNEAKWSITKRNEIYQAKHKRSKNNQWRGKNQRNIEWLVRLFIDLSLDAFLLQNSKRSTKVMHQYSKYILNSLKHRVSFRRRPASKGLLNVRKWTSKPGFKELIL
jgi:hypothetical protein